MTQSSPLPPPLKWAAEAMPRLLESMAPPAWLEDELLHRLILWLNHVLQAEPQATARLARQKGQKIELCWRDRRWQFSPTAAGLLERVTFEKSDLRLLVMDHSVTDMLSVLSRGEKPRVHVEGDVQLAAEINWCMDHVRWDIEEDLSRWLGDVPAHQLAQWGRQGLKALREFLQARQKAEPVTGGAS